MPTKKFGNMPPEQEEYHKLFHELYKLHPDTNRKKLEWKKKKKMAKGKYRNKNKAEIGGDNDLVPPPEIELPSNASSFAMFASVRLAILDRWNRYANQEYIQGSSCIPVPVIDDIAYQQSEDSDDNDDISDITKYPVTPHVVGLGLKSVFTLIKESRNTYPILCTKALVALFNVLQNQTPESLRLESDDVCDSLFEILQDLATSHGPESSVPNNGTHLTALACACLLSLVVARGNTGKFLSAAASLIMCPRALSMQNIKMPQILADLQRSVQSVFLGKMMKTDYFLYGIPNCSRMLSYPICFPSTVDKTLLEFKSMTCDGHYLYIFTNQGLFKVGTSYGGTVKGHIYMYKPDFYPKDTGTILYCEGKLFIKLEGRRGCEFLVVDRDSLLITSSVQLHSKDATASAVFSCGSFLGTITPAKEDGFLVRVLDQNITPAGLKSELRLDLARKCVDVLGIASYEEDLGPQTLSIKVDEEVASVHSGKEFGLLRTITGKVYYCGKAAALGLKQPGPGMGKWRELILPKNSFVKQIAIGHDGMHAVLLTEEKKVYFVGTSRRGEDGDLSKIRRQPKPSKVKKMTDFDHIAQFVACNSGTTAIITVQGELRMFGKDAAHNDQHGRLKYINDKYISKVALGKAHGVAICSGGHVYTFGINNKFQCGRDFIPPNKEETVMAMDTCGVQDELDVYDDLEDVKEELRNQPGSSEGNEPDGGFLRRQMCPPNMHSWLFSKCMVCTVCKQCTGYSSGCHSSTLPGRIPGTECGCGEGASGCVLCGCCKECSQLQSIDNNLEVATNDVVGGANNAGGVMRLELMYREKANEIAQPRQRARLQEQLKSRLVEAQNRRKNVVGVTSKQIIKGKSVKTPPSANSSPSHISNCPIKRSNGIAKDHVGSDVERDTTRVASLAPAKIYIPDDIPAVQVACGLHHSVILLQNGLVYTFGSNLYGQLGGGDILAKASLQLVKLPCAAGLVAAGSNHTVILTVKGEVYTCGAHQKGQLGRCSPPSNSSHDNSQPGGSTKQYQNPRYPWYATPAPIPNIGPRTSRKATWVGASGDQTFIKLDECLISASSLSCSTVMSNKDTLLITPKFDKDANRFKCLAIHKQDGECVAFKGNDQVNFRNKLVCLDTIYNVLWLYNPSSNLVELYNVGAKELLQKNAIEDSDCSKLNNDGRSKVPLILSPELALPLVAECQVTRIQAAINLLCCLDTLTTNDFQINFRKDDDVAVGNYNVFGRNDYQAVNRFESHGGGWGYSIHSVEAIRFMADTDILLGGLGLFGGRGDYTAKIKLFDVGPEGGEQEGDGQLIGQNDETPYDCAPRQKYQMMFEQSIPLQAHRWYVAWCQINGPSSDCGSSGQTMVTTEDQVVFYFKSSKKSNNGTDVNAGQIPQLLYRVITPEIRQPNKKYLGINDSPVTLTTEFSKTVTIECFHSLQSLLQWAWNTFKRGISEGTQQSYTLLELERLVYVCRASLRLLRTYTIEIYPNKVCPRKDSSQETTQLAECIGDVRTLLRQIMSDNLPSLLQSKKMSKSKPKGDVPLVLMNSVLDECHNTFVTCFHAFYPTAYLKWTCLCDLLYDIEHESSMPIGRNSQRLLSAFLRALSGPTVRLRSTFPLLSAGIGRENIQHKEISPSDNNFPTLTSSEVHYYPLLVEQMSYKSQLDSSMGECLMWKDVLNRLLNLISEPIRKELMAQKVSSLTSLTKNCCRLLARVVSELVMQCTTTDDDLYSVYGHTVHMTPPRFTRTNQSRTWNTGNGSPEAICLQVDRPGISIVGVGVYGGVGHYECDLEILEDQNTMSSTEGAHTHTQRWNCLESVKHCFESTDFNPDIAELKFQRPVPIKENVKYAIRLKNHGGKTNNGDGGLSCVKGSDNTTFTFSTCPLSFNGTTVARGQIPVILYQSNPVETARASSTKLEKIARQEAMSMTRSIVDTSCSLLSLAREKADEVPSVDILSNASIVKILLPLVMAHISSLANNNPRCAVEILNLIQEMLPHVAALNLIAGSIMPDCTGSANLDFDSNVNTTSQHYACVQSEHPYKPASVSNYRVKFPESVKWIGIEFDPNCSTVQPEDTLQLYVPSSCDHSLENKDCPDYTSPYWPVSQKFSYANPWPQNAILLPGNEVIFSLKTASDYLKKNDVSSYGFRAMVIGYEWPAAVNSELKHLESELAFLGGMCAANMIKKDLQLPSVPGQSNDIEAEETAEIAAQKILAKHGALLAKGLALSSPPTVLQALDGTLPYSIHSNERMFLRDFVNCVEGTSGGRLAQWLQPGSRLDPSKSHVIFSREEFRCGWPAMITILTCDQYADVVYVNHVTVEVKAIPIDKKDLGDSDAARKMRRVSQPDPLAFGGLPVPTLTHPYEPTIRDKMCFHVITAMKPYQNYSFEELRFTSPPVRRSSENMLVRPNGDGSYSATWTPASIGCYSIVVTIDGYEMEEVFKVEVKEPPQGLTPPTQNLAKKSAHQPSKLRKFIAKNSAGLRIRALPSLQSEQLGIVHVNGTIAFIDEVHNDDGVWLRLSAETIKQYGCIATGEAWCLQYNQHLGKTLLLPVEEPKTTLETVPDTLVRKQPEMIERKYQVIKSGASGHNVRTGPALDAPSIGVLVLGSIIGVKDYMVNKDGCWVLLDESTKKRYGFNTDFDAWSLAIGHNNKLYLGNVNQIDNDEFSPQLPPETDLLRIFSSKGYNFNPSITPHENQFSFTQPPLSASDVPVSTNPFVFGDEPVKPESPKVPRRDRRDSKLMSLPKWFKDEAKSSEGSEFSGVSVKELVKAIGESRANGNGITPPDTPKRSCSPRGGRFSPKPMSRSSSPIAVPVGRILLQDSGSSSPPHFGSPRSIGISPLVSGTGHELSVRRGSNQSDTSALVSSITRDISQSPSQSSHPRDLTPSPSSSSIHTRSEVSPPRTPNKKDLPNMEQSQSPRALTQTGTQTSPENSSIVGDVPSVKGHFSIGTVHKEERVSPKLNRKDRSTSVKSRSKRAISPGNVPTVAVPRVNYPTNQPLKKSISPSLAESFRAIFAAFVWHEGIVHDAMACASYLKFHPTLPKQGTRVVTRHGHSESPVDKRRQELSKEEKARQRHSVEVANAGNYLHIQPSTLESLTRSAANANANRCRRRVDGAIKEDGLEGGVGYQTVKVLPPALKCLVFLWEQVTYNSLQTMAVAKDIYISSTNHAPENQASRSTNDAKSSEQAPQDLDRWKWNNEAGWRKKYKCRPVNCELCGVRGYDPITKHMKQAHPGCGLSAGGNGFGPDGIFYNEGWAGSCGSSGISSMVPKDWYLMCARCRNKYHAARTLPSSSTQKPSKVKDKEKAPQLTNANGDLKPHLIMRNNALFLLDLASASDTNVGGRQRRPSSTVMPSVSEHHSPPDIGGPFNPVPPFQCLQTLGADNDMQERQFYEEVLRRQDVVAVAGQRPLSEVSLSDETDSAKSTRFHRSISMGTNGVPWSRTGFDGRIIMMRKRNNTTTEATSESESLLLCKPSPALLKLMPNMDGSSIVSNIATDSELQESNEQRAATYYLMERPVMEFITVPQDLDSLQLAMRQALRKAMCRVYAMQALNWFLRSVTQPVCLHDLLWWFVTSLQPHPVLDVEEGEENKPAKKVDEQICEHPLSDITIAGESVHPLPSVFHTLLQTIADLMIILPMGSALQQMAMRCWGIKFTPADHTFLHRSQVFSNISKILSRSEEIEDTTVSMHESSANQIFHTVEALQDLTPFIDIKASSRQAMVVSLTDGSTETFWESGDEDRHMNKHLVVTCRQGHQPKLVCVHVDNVRDLNYKIGTIYFHSGQSTEDLSKLRAIDVDMSLVGSWITCPIQAPDQSVIKIELKGVDNTIRLRQLCVLGEIDGEPVKIGKQYSATTVQQKNCEAETLRVFRLITSQVFGKLILGDQEQNNPDSGSVSASESLDPLEESNDLREHMVGILFSRSKLTHLQKQVIVHIVYAIKKETIKAREDWEVMLSSITADSASSELSQDPTKSTDTYCFEMLSMVLALSGSAVGRAYLSQQGGLLADLLSLLHIGSARVQRQVTSLLRRMLPEISPEALAAVMKVENLPAKDFNIVMATTKDNNSYFDTNKVGILDVFLSIIAKSLTLQVKLKSKISKSSLGKEVSTVNISACVRSKDALGARWWLRGSVSKKLSEVIIHLIKDMASGKLSEAWANVTKAAIAQNILNLTQLSEEQRNASICLQTPTLWMALASLCVLEKDHVERLSSGQWSQADGQQAPPGPTCTNHDDGETNAVVQCSICGNLCADCDRFLHLHRKTKHHQRQVCKEEEEAIKVDLHEGCGRMKLFWLLALADARTLKALVEYREGGPIQRTIGTSGQCRFCGAVGTSGLLAIGNVCADQECQDYALSACQKLLSCGHMCGGVQGEGICLPCLHGCSSDPTLRQDADDMCMICFTEALSCAPAIQLQCGHVFHLHCCTTVLTKRWVGPRITFSFSLCPICKKDVEHPVLKDLLSPTQNLFKDVKRKALMRLEYEGLHTSEPILTPGARFFNDPAGYAMDRYAYYVCFKCNKAYYGGEARCDAEIGENYDPTELVCGACSDVTRACVCPKHGTDFLEYKCRYCCSVAVFFCFGTTHFCNPCHDDFQRVTTLPKHQLPLCPAGPRAKQLEGDECPLHVQHPPTGEEFALGCGVCRNAHTF